MGNVVCEGTLDPGGVLRRFEVGDFVMDKKTARLEFDLGGIAPGTFDRLTTDDQIEIAGTLTIRLDEGYEPQFGDTWNIIDGGEQIGAFETVHLPETNVGHKYRVIYGHDLTYLILTCESDLTGDSLLDSSDITAFVGLFNAQALEADRNSDGDFNFFDIAAYLNEFALPCD